MSVSCKHIIVKDLKHGLKRVQKKVRVQDNSASVGVASDVNNLAFNYYSKQTYLLNVSYIRMMHTCKQTIINVLCIWKHCIASKMEMLYWQLSFAKYQETWVDV